MLSRVWPLIPETMPSPLTVPASTSTPAGRAMLMTTELLLLLLTVSHQVLEPALRAVQLVPDLKAAVDDADGQRVAVDVGDLDPGDGLVMRDDVEPAPDDAELERA